MGWGLVARPARSDPVMIDDGLVRHLHVGPIDREAMAAVLEGLLQE